MKTIHRFTKTPAILVLGLFALAFVLQPNEASAKDGWKRNGYQKHGYNMPPGQYKKYYGAKPHYHNRGWYQPAPRYEVYQGHRGYWQERNGLQVFINLN